MTENGESVGGAIGPGLAASVSPRPPRHKAPDQEVAVRELNDLVALLRQHFLASARPGEPPGPHFEALTQALTRTAAAAERLLALCPVTERVEPCPPPAGNRSRQVILVVERDPTLRRLHRAILERNGCQVLLAETGDEALQLYGFMASQVHTVILDAALPRWPPGRLIRELRSVRPDVRILLTSATDPIVEAAQLPVPVAGLLAKPFRAEQLLMLIQEPASEEPGAAR
jgi:CheY-like chemotaxis protein